MWTAKPRREIDSLAPSSRLGSNTAQQTTCVDCAKEHTTVLRLCVWLSMITENLQGIVGKAQQQTVIIGWPIAQVPHAGHPSWCGGKQSFKFTARHWSRKQVLKDGVSLPSTHAWTDADTGEGAYRPSQPCPLILYIQRRLDMQREQVCSIEAFNNARTTKPAPSIQSGLLHGFIKCPMFKDSFICKCFWKCCHHFCPFLTIKRLSDSLFLCHGSAHTTNNINSKWQTCVFFNIEFIQKHKWDANWCPKSVYSRFCC